jgi:hypothetical protein
MKRRNTQMLRYKFYMFILYNEFGKKLKDVLNSLFPGLIREPQPIRVPVRRRDERQRGMRR